MTSDEAAVVFAIACLTSDLMIGTMVMLTAVYLTNLSTMSLALTLVKFNSGSDASYSTCLDSGTMSMLLARLMGSGAFYAS